MPHHFLTDTTTASTLAFALWELAKSSETQRRVRDEILTAKRDALKCTGIDEIPFNHYDKMPLLTALTKVHRDFNLNAENLKLTFQYIGNAADTPRRVYECQTGGRRRSDPLITTAQTF